MKASLQFLGTGASAGVPLIGCDCAVCLSTASFNNRMRSSALLRINEKQLLIDIGPDFRTQALRNKISHLDGVLLTHAHYDHVAGIDDLRPIFFHRTTPLPILLSQETANELAVRYSYLLHSKHIDDQIALHILPKTDGEILFADVLIKYVSYKQANMQVNGYRFGNLAYVSDIREFPNSIFEQLEGVQYLIISALRLTPSLMHLSVQEAIDFATKLNVKYVWLTHLSHDLDYASTNAMLPNYIRLAYDGLEIEFE